MTNVGEEECSKLEGVDLRDGKRPHPPAQRSGEAGGWPQQGAEGGQVLGGEAVGVRLLHVADRTLQDAEGLAGGRGAGQGSF